MLTFAIVDDDEYDRRYLQQLLIRIMAEMNLNAEIQLFNSGPDFLTAAGIRDFRGNPGSSESVHSAGSGKLAAGDSSVGSAAAFRFDLVFMDIHMEPLNGIETAGFLRESSMTVFLVFMTAGENHYPAAFSVRAFDYIRKPAEESQIRRILEDVVRFRRKRAQFYRAAQAENLKVPYSEIRYICSDRNYLRLAVSKGSNLRFRTTFKSAVGQLQDDPRFLIINRGILINMQHVLKMTDPSCFMDDGAVFPLHRRRAAPTSACFAKLSRS